MTENELVERLAIRRCQLSHNNAWDGTLSEAHKEQHREYVRKIVLPDIRSYANALVEAATEKLRGQLDIIVRELEGEDDVWLANDYGGTGWEKEEIVERARKAKRLVVAAVVEACAKHESGDYGDGEYDWACVCGTKGHWSHDGKTDTWAEHLCSTATPEAAAKELERIKTEARLDEAKMWRFYTNGKDEPYWCAERIAALEAAARKEE